METLVSGPSLLNILTLESTLYLRLMIHLISVVDSEAKRAIEADGTSTKNVNCEIPY